MVLIDGCPDFRRKKGKEKRWFSCFDSFCLVIWYFFSSASFENGATANHGAAAGRNGGAEWERNIRAEL